MCGAAPPARSAEAGRRGQARGGACLKSAGINGTPFPPAIGLRQPTRHPCLHTTSAAPPRARADRGRRPRTLGCRARDSRTPAPPRRPQLGRDRVSHNGVYDCIPAACAVFLCFLPNLLCTFGLARSEHDEADARAVVLGLEPAGNQLGRVVAARGSERISIWIGSRMKKAGRRLTKGSSAGSRCAKKQAVPW
jgi:hypothetical protein